MYIIALVKIAYVIAAVLFIYGLKLMGRPRTAARGNLLGALGMLISVAVTIFLVSRMEETGFVLIIVGILVGSAIGAVLAVKIEMTAMPQLVALFNGFGGGASVFVAGAELLRSTTRATDVLAAIAATGVIGAVTFWGSLVAFGKLQEISWMKKSFKIPFQHVVNGVLVLAAVLLAFWMIRGGTGVPYVPIVLVASVLGVLLVHPIGGADMPVVIALLNSYSGLAAAATGFVINNNVLIIAGSLVGASGIILTNLMCKAMNRSLFNVLFGVMDGGSSSSDAGEIYATVRSTSA
ncbi:MAG: NAD(P)(+) transhydrogenase (Re/Si-specific) subunit beta, partial [Pirellulaceae bacterium]